MVVFLNLDEDVPDDPHADPNVGLAGQFSARLSFIKPPVINGRLKDAAGMDTERRDPNLNATTRALGCYPFVSLCNFATPHKPPPTPLDYSSQTPLAHIKPV